MSVAVPHLRPSESASHFFSVDVEEYFQVSAFETVAPQSRWASLPSRVERSTEEILALLAKHGATATFFTVGWIAEKFPRLVRAIADSGHEVASHTHLHRRITTLTPEIFRADLRQSRDILEQVSGQRVIGFRAPSFSIIPGVEWAWDILAEESFVYDSSMFPIWRPGYGNPGAPRDPFVMQTAAGPLWQFPLATATVGSLRLPAAGGAYLRILPSALVHAAVTEAGKRGAPAMCYIHPWEIDPGQPRLEVGLLTRIRHYTGLQGVASRLDRLLGAFPFTSVRDRLVSA